MDKPPLYYWTAAFCAKLFSPLLPLHDGARLASGFYNALTLIFIGLSGRRLYGENRGWAATIIFIGCLGLLVHAHQIVTDLALLTGCAMMLYGFSLSQERPIFAGILTGTGAGIGFMAKGFISPVFFILTAASLPLFFGNWRKRNYFSSMPIAFLAVLPWVFIWPSLLFLNSPQLFSDWLWAHNISKWIDYVNNGFNKHTLFYLQNLPWIAWPALPLSIWVVWKARNRLAHRDDLQLPLINFSVMIFALSFSGADEDVYALPMLLPITLLATASLSTLKRGAANALDWFGLMTYALLAVLMWWGWAGLLFENQEQATRWFKIYQPDFNPDLKIAPVVFAALATILWAIMVWQTGRSMRRAIINWASGVTLIWILAMTLWLPWLDSSKSYRSMVIALKQSLPEKYQCIAGENLGYGQRAMLHYFGNIITKSDPRYLCNFHLIQGNQISEPLLDNTQWKSIWVGNRKGRTNEYYRLYQKIEN